MSEDKLSYHEAAIEYNQRFVELAEKLSEELDHAVVKQWCASIAKMHKWHLVRHKNSLRRLNKSKRRGSPAVEETVTSAEPELHEVEPTLEDAQKTFAAQFEEREVSRDAGSGEFVSHEYAEENPETTVTETVRVEKKATHMHSQQLPCGPGCPGYNETGE